MILYILSQIWKSGAKIERLKTGELELHHHEFVDDKILKAAEPIFDDIDNYLKSVEGMSAVDKTIWKMIVTFANWQAHEKITNFLNGDEQGLMLFLDYQGKLALNGWKELYDDWRQYETPECEKLKSEIYARAVAFAKGVQ
ncbi:MAG: hypothetical protein ABS882_03495 [Lysinibacillus sp.]